MDQGAHCLTKMEIKKSTLYFGFILLILVVAGFLFIKGGNSAGNENVLSEGSQAIPEGTQRLVIGEKNLNYYPDMIKVKANQPVSISLDSSVQGCLRSFTIRDLGVAKYVKTQEETIDFTPNKKGTFTFTCSMGMGYGKIIVE